MSEEQPVKVLACVACGAPVVSGSGSCPACDTPMSERAAPYIARQELRPEVGPMFKWWGICSALVWIFSGFDLGTTSSLILLGISIFFLLKIMRTWVAE